MKSSGGSGAVAMHGCTVHCTHARNSHSRVAGPCTLAHREDKHPGPPRCGVSHMVVQVHGLAN